MCESQLGVFLLPTFGPMELGKINAGVVLAWYAELTQSGMAPAAIAKQERELAIAQKLSMLIEQAR